MKVTIDITIEDASSYKDFIREEGTFDDVLSYIECTLQSNFDYDKTGMRISDLEGVTQ